MLSVCSNTSVRGQRKYGKIAVYPREINSTTRGPLVPTCVYHFDIRSCLAAASQSLHLMALMVRSNLANRVSPRLKKGQQAQPACSLNMRRTRGRVFPRPLLHGQCQGQAKQRSSRLLYIRVRPGRTGSCRGVEWHHSCGRARWCSCQLGTCTVLVVHLLRS